MNDPLREVRQLSEDSRQDWRRRSRRVLASLETEAEALQRALGAISWDEAVEGFKRNAAKTIEAVMR